MKNQYTLLQYKEQYSEPGKLQKEINNLAAELRRYRRMLNISQAKVAKMLGMGQNTISAFEFHKCGSFNSAWRINEFCEIVHQIRMHHRPATNGQFVDMVEKEMTELELDY